MGVVEYEKITDEEAFAIENDCDPIEAPPGPELLLGFFVTFWNEKIGWLLNDLFKKGKDFVQFLLMPLSKEDNHETEI